MLGLAELIFSFCDLLEAEGRLLRINILRTMRGCLILGASITLGTIGVGFLVAAAYYGLLTIFSLTATLAIMGISCILVALILLWSVAYCGKQTKKQKAAGKKNA